MSSYPQTIAFVDGATGQVTEQRPIQELPESLRSVQIDGQMVPVARIETFVETDRRRIKKYDSNGQLLETIVMLTSKP